MTPELRERLEKMEMAVQMAKSILDGPQYALNSRTAVVVGTISQIFEHHEAMLLLIVNDKLGSAFSLGRAAVEGSYRGIWLDSCASDSQLKHFVEKDEINLSMAEIAKAIDAKCLPSIAEEPEAQDFFHAIKKRTWGTLNSFTHTGMMQIDRRFRNGELQAQYTDDDTFHMVSLATTLVLLLVMTFLANRDQPVLHNKVEQLLSTYFPVA